MRVLTLWFAGIYPRSRYSLIGVALFVMGVVIEWLQGAMNLGRQADMRDVVREHPRHRRRAAARADLARRLGSARRDVDEVSSERTNCS